MSNYNSKLRFSIYLPLPCSIRPLSSFQLFLHVVVMVRLPYFTPLVPISQSAIFLISRLLPFTTSTSRQLWASRWRGFCPVSVHEILNYLSLLFVSVELSDTLTEQKENECGKEAAVN